MYFPRQPPKSHDATKLRIFCKIIETTMSYSGLRQLKRLRNIWNLMARVQRAVAGFAFARILDRSALKLANTFFGAAVKVKTQQFAWLVNVLLRNGRPKPRAQPAARRAKASRTPTKRVSKAKKQQALQIVANFVNARAKNHKSTFFFRLHKLQFQPREEVSPSRISNFAGTKDFGLPSMNDFSSRLTDEPSGNKLSMVPSELETETPRFTMHERRKLRYSANLVAPKHNDLYLSSMAYPQKSSDPPPLDQSTDFQENAMKKVKEALNVIKALKSS